MSKNLQLTINGERKAKRENESHYGFFPWKNITLTDQKGDEIATHLFKYVEDETIHALRMSQFFRFEKISTRSFYTLLGLSEKLQEAHKWALMVFAERRELGMLEGRYNAQGSMKILPRYCTEWKAQMINEAKLKTIAAIYAAKATAGTFNAADLEVIDHMYDDLEKDDVGNDPGALEQVQTKAIPESTD